jgi:hypothetical protein
VDTHLRFEIEEIKQIRDALEEDVLWGKYVGKQALGIHEAWQHLEQAIIALKRSLR